MSRRPDDRPPKWGLDRWYDDAIPVVLGLIAAAFCVWLFLTFLNASW
jgi:hypothetical protein